MKCIYTPTYRCRSCGELFSCGKNIYQDYAVWWVMAWMATEYSCEDLVQIESDGCWEEFLEEIGNPWKTVGRLSPKSFGKLIPGGLAYHNDCAGIMQVDKIGELHLIGMGEFVGYVKVPKEVHSKFTDLQRGRTRN